MPNSADNSLDVNPSLHEDSDVIELTEEVEEARKKAAAAAEQSDDFDLFSDELSMPEFRVPDARTTTDPNGVPQAAILGRKTRPRQHTPALETLKLNLSEIEQAVQQQPPASSEEPSDAIEEGAVPASMEIPSTEELGALEESSIISLETEVELGAPTAEDSPNRPEQVETMQIPSLDRTSGQPHVPESEAEDEELDATNVILPKPDASSTEGASSDPAHDPDEDELAYDRQELVRTIQMEPVSREAIELSIDLERLHNAQALEDQRFAPDVVNRPPRILNRKWVEGVENILEQSPVQEQPVAAATPPAQPPPRPAQQPPAVAAPAGPPANHAPPPKASAPPASRQGFAAQQPAPSAAPQQQRPPQQQAPPARQPQATPLATPAVNSSTPPKADAELDGLVQELIEESAPAPKPAPNSKAARQQAARDNWFKDVFTEEFLRTIPRDVERFTEREARFIQDSLSLQNGSRILDLACGFGRHAVALTQRKLEVVGLDLSMALLQRALQEAQRRNLSIKFVHGDMRSMNFNEIFDGCYLWQSSFGYFDDMTNFKVLKDIHRALKPGGRFILDLMNRDYVVREMPSRCWWEGRECIFLEEVDFDFSRSILHTKRSFIYEDGSPPLEQNSYVRMYNLHEISHLLKNAGFRVIELSGGLSMRGRFLGTNSDRMIFLLEKVPMPQRRA